MLRVRYVGRRLTVGSRESAPLTKEDIVTSLLIAPLALLAAQSWSGFDFMGVHGGEFVVREHTAVVVQCAEEQEQILVTVHVPHDETAPGTTARRRTLYLQLDGGETQTVEKTEDRPFPGVFQFEPEEWFVDFLLAGGDLVARFEDETLQVPVDGAFMENTLDHCTGGAHVH